MAIEIMRNTLKMDQVIGEELSQALVEGDIIVSEGKSDIAKVLDIKGNAVLSSREVIQDRVMVEGIIYYNVLYTVDGENISVESTDGELGFTHYIDIPGAKPKMSSTLKLNVEHIDFDHVDKRRINVKTVINMDCQVKQIIQLEAIQDFRGAEHVEVLRDTVKLFSTMEEGNSQSLIHENIELPDNMPSIQSILRSNAKIKITEKKTADNKVIVHGDMVLDVLYMSGEEESPINYFKQDIPFSHQIDIPGVYQGMDCAVDVDVQEIYVEGKENISQQMRIFGFEVVLDFNAQVIDIQERQLVVDAYSTGLPIDVKKKKVNFKQMVGENQSQASIKRNITFDNNIPDITRILYIQAKPIITDQSVGDNIILIEGILTADIIYQYDDGKLSINSLQEDIPFKHSIDLVGISEDMDLSVDLDVVHIAYTLLAPTEMELRVALAAKASVYQNVDKDILLSVEELEEELALDSGIFIYFVQPGDTLWSIAKKYNTTIANVLKYNKLTDHDKLSVGDKVIVFKKYEFNIS